MRLTLEVISANGDALGSNRSKTIGSEGAQIGRSKESDWVINDPYISRIHARVRFVNGTYYVEGTGRNPLALNDPSNVVPNNQPQLLRSGDRFFLDQYEIRVTLDSSSERKPAPVDPFQESDSPTVRVPPVSVAQHPWQPEVSAPGANIHAAEDASLDPLAILSGNRPPAQAQPVRPINLEQMPAVEAHFAAPQVVRPLQSNDPTPLPVNAPTQKIPVGYTPGMTHVVPAQAEPTTRKPAATTPNPGGGQNGAVRAGKGIPQGWLSPTSFTSAEPPPGQPPNPPTTPLHSGGLPERAEPRSHHPPADRHPDRPADRPIDRPVDRPVDRTERPNPFDRPEARGNAPERPELGQRPERPEPGQRPDRSHPLPHPSGERPDARPDVRPNQFQRPEGRGHPFERGEPRVNPVISKTIHREQPNTAHAPPAESVATPREARSASLGSANLEQLLAAAGVAQSQMSAELAQELGEVLRVVVQGVMEVLQSRAEIKSQLRMSMTLMKPAENNPLKFSPNVEAALHTLLVERNRGYLPTVRAFQEALTDIRHHQIAVLQGIRSAFHAMLEQFNPVRLEQEFERHGAKRGGLLNVGAKGRFRDAYVEEYERLTRDPDDSFKRLFGEYFAQAYEDQMDQLKAAARNEVR